MTALRCTQFSGCERVSASTHLDNVVGSKSRRLVARGGIVPSYCYDDKVDKT